MFAAAAAAAAAASSTSLCVPRVSSDSRSAYTTVLFARSWGYPCGELLVSCCYPRQYQNERAFVSFLVHCWSLGFLQGIRAVDGILLSEQHPAPGHQKNSRYLRKVRNDDFDDNDDEFSNNNGLQDRSDPHDRGHHGGTRSSRRI